MGIRVGLDEVVSKIGPQLAGGNLSPDVMQRMGAAAQRAVSFEMTGDVSQYARDRAPEDVMAASRQAERELEIGEKNLDAMRQLNMVLLKTVDAVSDVGRGIADMSGMIRNVDNGQAALTILQLISAMSGAHAQ